MKKRSWDTEAAQAMYDAGKSDREIAEALGISRNSVYHWRFVQNLPSHTMRGQRPEKPRETEPEAAAPRPSPPSRPLALPAAKGPLELSVELDGRAFALRAPDLEDAARIYEYAGRVLESLGLNTARLKEENQDA